MKLAHIVNPVNIGPESDLFIAQPITFETMRVAREEARGIVDVELYTTQYPEDHKILPEGFITLPDLKRSILDVDNFNVKRKLPLLKDILDRLYDATDADYLIYTNVDISLMPFFYVTVKKMLEEHDGLIINRRDIPNQYERLDELPLMFAEIGRKTAGFDCFVFPRLVYTQFQLGTIAIGVSRVGIPLYANMVVYCDKVKEYRAAHMTFHIGSDRVWKNDQFRNYDQHNQAALLKTLIALREVIGSIDETTELGRFLLDLYHRRSALDFAYNFLKQDNPYLHAKWEDKTYRRVNKWIRSAINFFKDRLHV